MDNPTSNAPKFAADLTIIKAQRKTEPMRTMRNTAFMLITVFEIFTGFTENRQTKRRGSEKSVVAPWAKIKMTQKYA